MVTKNEQLQHAWHRYSSEHGYLPSGLREATEWAVREGLLSLPRMDPYEILTQQMARALREEKNTDRRGRKYRVNHAVRVTRDGVQLAFWGIMGYTPAAHIETSLAQRREQIISDCLKLKIDVDAYNEIDINHPPFQLVLDFTDDVAEREANFQDEDDELPED